MSLVITRIARYGRGSPAADEDALTMMFEAGRRLAYSGERLALASTSLARSGGVQAGLLIEALGLPPHSFCLECTTSNRAALEAMRALGPGMILAADGGYAAGLVLRAGPGGMARVLAMQGAVAGAPGAGSLRAPDYAEAIYTDLVRAAMHGLAGDIIALNAPDPRFAKRMGLAGELVLAPPGSGAAGPLLALEEALRRATPGRRILLAAYGAGSAADALLLEKTFG